MFRPRAPERWMRGVTVGGEGESVEDSGHRQPVSRLTRHDLLPRVRRRGARRPRPGLERRAPHRSRSRSHEGSRWPLARINFDPLHHLVSVRSQPDALRHHRPHHRRLLVGRDDRDSIAARLRLSARGAISGTLERNHAALPEGRFDTTLTKVRVDWSFSTRAVARTPSCSTTAPAGLAHQRALQPDASPPQRRLRRLHRHAARRRAPPSARWR